MAEIRDIEPAVTAADLDEDVAELTTSLDEFYGPAGKDREEFPRSLDRALRAIFEDLGRPEDNSVGARRLAYDLIRRLEQDLVADVYRWTGHFPERTRPLLRHLARRAEELKQVYPEERELQAAVALTTLVTALAMNHIRYGSYLP